MEKPYSGFHHIKVGKMNIFKIYNYEMLNTYVSYMLARVRRNLIYCPTLLAMVQRRLQYIHHNYSIVSGTIALLAVSYAV